MILSFRGRLNKVPSITKNPKLTKFSYPLPPKICEEKRKRRLGRNSEIQDQKWTIYRILLLSISYNYSITSLKMGLKGTKNKNCSKAPLPLRTNVSVHRTSRTGTVFITTIYAIAIPCHADYKKSTMTYKVNNNNNNNNNQTDL